MSPQDTRALLERAWALQSAWRNGAMQPLLRGKNLGLVCNVADGTPGALFQRAATALGAHVAVLQPSLSERSSAEEVRQTAHVLGRLYDAIDCIALDAGLIRRIGTQAQVPVFEDIGTPGHPTARLAGQLDPSLPESDRHCLVIQAVLVGALT